MSKLMYSCEQAAKLSSQAMEQPLTPSERVLLSMHYDSQLAGHP